MNEHSSGRAQSRLTRCMSMCVYALSALSLSSPALSPRSRRALLSHLSRWTSLVFARLRSTSLVSLLLASIRSPSPPPSALTDGKCMDCSICAPDASGAPSTTTACIACAAGARRTTACRRERGRSRRAQASCSWRGAPCTARRCAPCTLHPLRPLHPLHPAPRGGARPPPVRGRAAGGCAGRL